MDYSQKLALSYYKTIATLNEAHNIFLVQHRDTQKIYVKKILTVYNIDVYNTLFKHPICGIPQIVDYCVADNQLILIEHYISGRTLEEILCNGNLSLSVVIHYVLELCSILHRLHSMNPPIVHRDIKPSNIIITEHNHVFLLDFNAAKQFSVSTTSDTILLGTKGYAAPEQYGFGSSSPKTDIYAVGILLKELTSSLPAIPASLVNIIEKCIKIDPSERYNTVWDLENALKSIFFAPKPEVSNPPSYKEVLFPGFRTGTVWKMFIAIPAYLFILWLSLSLEVENTYGLALWVERIFCLFMFLCSILITFNYMNVHKYFPLCTSKYRIVRFLGISIVNITMVLTLFIILFIIESIFFI